MGGILQIFGEKLNSKLNIPWFVMFWLQWHGTAGVWCGDHCAESRAVRRAPLQEVRLEGRPGRRRENRQLRPH